VIIADFKELAPSKCSKECGWTVKMQITITRGYRLFVLRKPLCRSQTCPTCTADGAGADAEAGCFMARACVQALSFFSPSALKPIRCK